MAIARSKKPVGCECARWACIAFSRREALQGCMRARTYQHSTSQATVACMHAHLAYICIARCHARAKARTRTANRHVKAEMHIYIDIDIDIDISYKREEGTLLQGKAIAKYRHAGSRGM